MTETKFTQGPWKAQFDATGTPIGVWAGDEDSGHYVCPPNDMNPEDTNPSDLHLIAAAPSLYEALRQLERAFAVGAEGYRAVADRQDALRSARAALRAARGEEA